MQLRMEYSRVINQTLYIFSSTVQMVQLQVLAAHSVFSVQNVQQMQQCTISLLQNDTIAYQ